MASNPNLLLSRLSPAAKPPIPLTREGVAIADPLAVFGGWTSELAPVARQLLAGVFQGSPYLHAIATQRPALFKKTLASSPEKQVTAILQRVRSDCEAAQSMRDIMRILREAKTEVAFVVGLADLAGVWPVEDVTQWLSEAADQFVAMAVRFLLKRAAEAGHLPQAQKDTSGLESGLIVLGMGKLGACELNYSSDIDLIVFFDPTRARLTPGFEANPFFVRLVRDLVHLLQERTGDGYVFRTDLRLRPDPGSTQAAISTEAAFNYYENRGQNWERAAFIKARPIAGDIEAGIACLRRLNSYIWRRYLDYNAIADIHAMKRQIHAAKGHQSIAVAGHNIKLGRGGIREIEFFVQSQQLIAGGRQPDLRASQTLVALDALARHEWIDTTARDELAGAYRFLRRIEHRLQMVADQQTHTLPKTQAGLEAFAHFAGYDGRISLEQDLRFHMQSVERHYAALFETGAALTSARVAGNLVFTGDADDPGTLETLRRLGFQNPAAVIGAVKGWHYGRYRAMRSERAREILTEFTPALLEALGDTGDPDLALATFDAFLSEMPSALQFFSLLRANPPLLALLAQIMGTAPRLARILTRHRDLMDAILDPRFLTEKQEETALRAYVRDRILSVSPYEARLGRAREVCQEQSFYIGVEMLSRHLNPLEAGAAYSSLAESLLEPLLDAVQAEYGEDNPPPAILAMGKLGGREMTATSDVDLIAIYEAGQRPFPDAARHYARMTQRFVSALSAPTPEGQLYAVDLRLRPSGKAGPVAVSLDGFVSYQKNEAWTWEHLALTRARPVAGPEALRDAIAKANCEILTTPRDRARTANNIRDMRALIGREKEAKGVWDIRNAKGGLVDVEFTAQFLQLCHAAQEPRILHQNTIQALMNLEDAGFLRSEDARALREAAALFQSLTQVIRLCTGGAFDPATAPRDLLSLVLHAGDETTREGLEAKFKSTYAGVSRLFDCLVV